MPESEVETALAAPHQIAEAQAAYNVAETGSTAGSSTGANSIQVETRIAGKNGGTLVPVRSSERGRELVRLRWDGVSAAARRGLAAAGKQIPDVVGNGPVRVVEYLVSQHTLNAADPSARGSAQSFKQVMDLAYPKPDREVSAAPGIPAGGLSVTLSADLARELVAALRAEHNPPAATASE